MKREYRFIRPVDVLYLRGNRLFGESGDHAKPLMPPWPSLFAGALRSRILVDRHVNFESFKQEIVGDPNIFRVLGTPKKPGTFRICMSAMARSRGSSIEGIFPLPADITVFPEEDEERSGGLRVSILEPVPRQRLSGVRISSPLPYISVLREAKAAKVHGGFWLRESGLVRYLAGSPIESEDLVPVDDLWLGDPRLGIALDWKSRTAARGRIYTTEAVAMKEGTGFLVGIEGAEGLLPRDGLLRLGGDGRGAEVVAAFPAEKWNRLPEGPRFKMILSTPGIFPGGWVPPGIETREGRMVFSYRGLEARLMAAVVPRYQVVSGWDVAEHRPKPTERAVPAGAVYWFEATGGDVEVLGVLIEGGLWPILEEEDGQVAETYTDQRRAEGFNNVWFAEWKV